MGSQTIIVQKLIFLLAGEMLFIEKLEVVFLSIFLADYLNSTSASDLDTVKFVFYHGPTYEDHKSFDLDKVAAILQHARFIHNQTNCYIHGYNGSQEAFSIRVLVDSYLKRNTINLLTIDWKVQAGGTYLSAQENLLKLSPKVADSILKLFHTGLEPDSFSLVGHSLGGLGVGLIGREIRKETSGRIILNRITALDPSNAEAHDVFIVPPLTKADAKFVDVIHTDAGKTGSPYSLGHADFWPNDGKAIQPGCPASGVNDKCSHRKAWAYWAESVFSFDPTLFLAKRETSLDDANCMAKTLNSENDYVQMGLNCPRSARGNYFLRVESDYAAIPGAGLNS